MGYPENSGSSRNRPSCGYTENWGTRCGSISVETTISAALIRA